MKFLKLIVGVYMGVIVAACGGGGSSSSNGDLSSATTSLCNDLSGLEAIYWGFINGELRADLPSTAFTIPFNINTTQPSYTNSNPYGLLLGFSVPAGWTASDAGDTSGFAFPTAVVGANLFRDDNEALWRYIPSAQIGQAGYTSQGILDAEINTTLNALGNPASTTEQCAFNFQQPGILGPESFAGKIVRAGNYTIMAKAHVLEITGTAVYYDSFLSYALTAENTTLINNIFIPMITQLYGGGSDPAQCEDGDDNDNDNLTDYPADPQCNSPSDDNESS